MRGLIDLLYNHQMEDLTREQKIEAAHQAAMQSDDTIVAGWQNIPKVRKNRIPEMPAWLANIRRRERQFRRGGGGGGFRRGYGRFS